MDRIKVLIVTEAVSYGGNNIVAINLEKHLNKDKFECNYCVRRDSIGAFEQETIDRGIRVIHVPDSELGYLKSYKFYKSLFQSERFDIVHCHLPFVSGLILYAAKQCGVEKRVAHAHFSQPYTDTAIYSKKKQLVASVYRVVMRQFLKRYCNLKLACGKEAGEFLYGKKEFSKNGVLLNNGIETDKFEYNPKIRNEVREEFGITDEIVLGHIGQMYSVKNQSFIIDIFNEFIKNNNSKLILVGDGTDREMLENKVHDLNLDGRVIFTGKRNDAERLYQAFDCFVFPSIHEGFPLTLIEAQASKLPCVVSYRVTESSKINSNFVFENIFADENIWCESIVYAMQAQRESIDISELKSRFDIKSIAHKLEEMYLS